MDAHRPAHLSVGTRLGSHYTVEGRVRLTEGRTFYLASDRRPDLVDRRWLVSARWSADRFDPYLTYFRKDLSHPGLASPTDAFVEHGLLFSVVPYLGEGLMVDEPAPLGNGSLLDLAQRIVGTVAYLHRRGVRLAALTRANLLVSIDGTVRLYDVEVDQVLDDDAPVPPEHDAGITQAVGELLRRYCDIEADALVELLLAAEEGELANLKRFGREIEVRHDAYAGVSYPPVLAGTSDVGLIRALNEDNWRWVRLSDRARLYAVADGMGGHAKGEVASALAIKTLCEAAREREALSPDGEDAVKELLGASFQLANNTVKDEADARGIDMGTTLVCMLVLDGRVGFIANVGDSRGYLLRRGMLLQLTTDHSLVQKLVERGRLTPEQAIDHPQNNILLRTVGTERDIEIDIFRVEFEPGDRVLMCSDGLWGEVRHQAMESILNTCPDPRVATRELVRAAHHAGGKDNVTLMIVGV